MTSQTKPFPIPLNGIHQMFVMLLAKTSRKPQVKWDLTYTIIGLMSVSNLVMHRRRYAKFSIQRGFVGKKYLIAETEVAMVVANSSTDPTWL